MGETVLPCLEVVAYGGDRAALLPWAFTTLEVSSDLELCLRLGFRIRG